MAAAVASTPVRPVAEALERARPGLAALDVLRSRVEEERKRSAAEPSKPAEPRDMEPPPRAPDVPREPEPIRPAASLAGDLGPVAEGLVLPQARIGGIRPAPRS